MSLRIYRIDRSLFGKLNNYFKPPQLPVASLASIGNPKKNLSDLFRKNCYVLSKNDEIQRFSEAYNNEWVDDVYYIRHPKKIKTNILIPALSFHKYIIREQIADIISYVRANLNIKEMEINISNNNIGKIKLEGVIDEIPLAGNAKFESNNSYTVTIKCPRPLKASEKETNYTWIDDFKQLKASIDEVYSGTFEIRETFDLSFGLSIKEANVIEASAEWNTNHSFYFKLKID